MIKYSLKIFFKEVHGGSQGRSTSSYLFTEKQYDAVGCLFCYATVDHEKNSGIIPLTILGRDRLKEEDRRMSGKVSDLKFHITVKVNLHFILYKRSPKE